VAFVIGFAVFFRRQLSKSGGSNEPVFVMDIESDDEVYFDKSTASQDEDLPRFDRVEGNNLPTPEELKDTLRGKKNIDVEFS